MTAKNIKNKDISSVHTKANKEEEQTPHSVQCLRECEIPFVGYWKGGEIITDPHIIKKIGDNPNFKQISQGGLK